MSTAISQDLGAEEGFEVQETRVQTNSIRLRHTPYHYCSPDLLWRKRAQAGARPPFFSTRHSLKIPSRLL